MSLLLKVQNRHGRSTKQVEAHKNHREKIDENKLIQDNLKKFVNISPLGRTQILRVVHRCLFVSLLFGAAVHGWGALDNSVVVLETSIDYCLFHRTSF